MVKEVKDISPEEKLWKTVIINFLHDLQRDVLNYKQSLNGKRGQYYKAIQAHISLSEHDHMKYLCDLANVDNTALKRAVFAIAKGEKEISIPRSDFFWSKKKPCIF